MKKIIYFTEFNKESLDQFISSVNDSKDWITMYIDSPWWESDIRDICLDIVESYESDVDVIWVWLMSNWFEFFRRVKAKSKKLLPWCYGMVHTEACLVNVWAKGIKRWEFDNFADKEMESKDYDISFLSEYEKAKYEAWGDVYLNRKRLTEIFWLE
jgi:hypothetical protein